MKFLSKLFLLTAVSFLFTIIINASLFANESLKAPLINIPGWQAEEAISMNFDMQGVKMMNVVRSYENGDNTFDTAIMITSLQMGLAPFQQMNMSQGSVKISSTQMDGFKVMHTHDGNEKSGTIMILLGKTQINSATFSLTYEGLSDETSIALAKKFDWKTIQKAVSALMK